jgi:uncharacterized membrane protein (UPF0127 family)
MSKTFLLSVPVLLLFSDLTACRAQPRVIIMTEDRRELPFQVEIADSPAKRELGLQYRRELDDGRGMLFIFPSERQHSFWMKNTPIHLDIIFIDRDQKIAGIVHEAVPFSLDSRSVPVSSQYVLEIKGGLSRRYGIREGNAVRFERVSVEAVKE